jgi:hypothetical protein
MAQFHLVGNDVTVSLHMLQLRHTRFDKKKSLLFGANVVGSVTCADVREKMELREELPGRIGNIYYENVHNI